MPEKKDTVCISTKEPAAIYHVCITFYNGMDECIVLFRVIFQVSILYDRKLTCCFGDPGMQCSAFAHVDLMSEIMDIHFRMLADISQNGSFSVVFRTIIDNDHFFFDVVKKLYCGYPVEYAMNGR